MQCLFFSFIMILICIVLVNSFGLKIGYGYHTYAPDLYYIVGSMAALGILISLKNTIVILLSSKKFLVSIFDYIYKYTMPIFLLHTFAIFICENYFGLMHPKNNFVLYGVIKFSLVMILTAIMSYPFLQISSYLAKTISKFYPFLPKRNQSVAS